MRVIGLTGGIGAGKSTVASALQKLGAVIIDADKIAKDLMKKGNKVYCQIIDYFGKDILDEKGEIKRKKLAKIVFDDKKKLAVLNEMTHKEVYIEMEKMLELLRKDNYKGIAVLDVPLPNEEFRKMSDEIWVVDCEDETRISRVMERLGITREEAVKRMESQISRKDYLRLADKVIKNNGTIEEIDEKVLLFL